MVSLFIQLLSSSTVASTLATVIIHLPPWMRIVGEHVRATPQAAQLVGGAVGEGTVAVDAGRVEEARRHRAHPPLHRERHALHVHHRMSFLAGLEGKIQIQIH